MGNRSR